MPQRGFTFVEILIVLAIVGVMAAIALPAYERYVEKARVVEATVGIGEMATKIRTYEMAKGALPSTLSDVGYGSKLDPWGRPYEYFNLNTSKGNGQARKDKKLAPLNSDYDLYSVGRDGITQSSLGNAASRDDVVRARDGGFIGLAAEFDP